MSGLIFSWVDFAVFAILLIATSTIGVFFALCKKTKQTTEEYLYGGRSMKMLPVAISLIASQISGISIMSVPAEMYGFGTQYAMIIAVFLAIPFAMNNIILPIFYSNNITNCYSYLELRFNKTIKSLITAIFVMNIMLAVPVVIYIPSMAFAEVSGINVHVVNSVVCLICAIYTSLGGMKGVVWADVLQATIMFSSCIIVSVTGIIKIGGLGEVFRRNEEGGRLQIFNMDTDFTIRLTFWNSLLGNLSMWLAYSGLNQSCIQRISAISDLKNAKKATWIFMLGCSVIMSLNCITGLIMYAWYHGCDPIALGTVEKTDKLMPHFVQEVVGQFVGLPGIFISCVFSAGLSTMAAMMQALSSIIHSQYIKPLNLYKPSDQKDNIALKCIILALGAYAAFGGVIVDKTGSILQLVTTAAGSAQGPILGAFMLGMLYPKASSKAVLWATVISTSTIIAMAIGNQMYLIKGLIHYPKLPTTVDLCPLSNDTIFDITDTTISYLEEAAMNLTDTSPVNESVPYFFRFSFIWLSFLSTMLLLFIGVTLSAFMDQSHLKTLDRKLIAPIAWCLIPKEYQHQEVPLEDVHEDGKNEKLQLQQ